MKKISNYQWPIEPEYIVVEHDKYGIRKKQYVLFKERAHSGFDITAEIGTKVHSSSNGKVIFAGLDPKIVSNECQFNERYGNEVEILNEDGNRCIYGHLSKVLVKAGDIVDTDTVIGLSGCSGGSRIPHLHFEIRNGNKLKSGLENTIDPLLILPEIDFSKLTKHFSTEPYCKFWEVLLQKEWDFDECDVPYRNDKNFIK